MYALVELEIKLFGDNSKRHKQYLKGLWLGSLSMYILMFLLRVFVIFF